jgi:uncharacterized protein involved in high-affinity Fe2+ transport
MHRIALAIAAAAALSWPHHGQAREYYVGGPLHEHDMEIVANYLVGIEMDPMPPGMPMGTDAIHLEADVHATADNRYGYPDGGWIPYLTIDYALEKVGTDWRASGKLLPMTARDGPHYANNVRMAGAGQYKLTYRFAPPVVNGFLRHTDKETGVPPWWQPFEVTFTFAYPQT